MLLEDMRVLLGNKRRNPDRRLESTRTNFFEHSLHVSTEGRSGFEPVAHERLITIIDLNVFETRRVFRDEVEIVEHLLRRDARTKAVPGAPARRRCLAAQRWMIL